VNWYTDLGEIVEKTFMREPVVRGAFLNHLFQGEWSEQRNPAPPIMCYVIYPRAEDVGTFDGTLKCQFALGVTKKDGELYNIFEKVDKLLLRQNLKNDSVSLVVLEKVDGPIKIWDPDTKCNQLVGQWSLRGIKIQ
jgi:hypothetical protein